MSKYIWLIPGILITAMIFFSCNKDDESCTNEAAFCELIDKKDFDSTSPIVDDFLKTLTYDTVAGNNEMNLEKLKDWLDCKSCVKKVKRSDAYIMTGILQAELMITFSCNGKRVDRVMDVLLDDTLRVFQYHD